MKDKEQFIETIQDNSGIIHKAASLYTSNPQDKEDLVQEIIYQLWKSYDSFDNKSAISTWIYRVAMNVAIYHLKQSKKRPATIPIDHASIDIHSNSGKENQTKWNKIRDQINGLNLLEKGIILLYLEGKNYRDIGAIIGITESNVGTRMARIKEKLKNNLSNK